jgi:polyisoprenyl-phosphate glycosyltransferase
MKRAIVTGAGGFIGSAVTKRLVDMGIETHAFVRPGSGALRLEGVPCIIHEVDLTDADSIQRAIAPLDGVTVFHLAASNIVSGKAAPARELFETNVLGTNAILTAAAASHAESFISVGSFLEYGSKDVAITEDMRCDPPEIYSISKLAGTLLVQTASKSLSMPTIAFRLFTPYGPEIQEGRLIRNVLSQALKNESIILTRPTITRDFIYVEDAVDLLIEAAEKTGAHAGEIFNMGSGVKTTLQEVADVGRSLTGSSSELAWGSFGSVAYDADTWQADMTKTYNAFAWRPTHTFSEGMQKTIEWLEAVKA